MTKEERQEVADMIDEAFYGRYSSWRRERYKSGDSRVMVKWRDGVDDDGLWVPVEDWLESEEVWNIRRVAEFFYVKLKGEHKNDKNED